jgi:glucose-1-phosphatase
MQSQSDGQPYIKAVIFDLGGVILRTEDPQPRVELAQRLGITRWELEEAVFNNPISQQAERGLATAEEVWAEVGRRLNLPGEEIVPVRRAFFGGDRVDFELIELIQQLRGQYTTALLSNTWLVDLPGFLRDDLQVPDTFDVVISSAQARVAKPDAEIFHLALEQVNAQPAEAVFVDDNAANIQAAAGLGIHTVRFLNPSQAQAELLALAPLNSA